MNQQLQSAFERLASSGWRLVKSPASDVWPESIHVRYPWVPAEVREALTELREIVSADESSTGS